MSTNHNKTVMKRNIYFNYNTVLLAFLTRNHPFSVAGPSPSLWDALEQCPFFRTVSHVEDTVWGRDGDAKGMAMG